MFIATYFLAHAYYIREMGIVSDTIAHVMILEIKC